MCRDCHAELADGKLPPLDGRGSEHDRQARHARVFRLGHPTTEDMVRRLREQQEQQEREGA